MRELSVAAPSTSSQTVANVALLLMTLVVTVIALEILARIFVPAPLPWNHPQLRYRSDPTLIFAWQPNQRGFTADKEVVINDRGLRGPVVAYDRAPALKRILFLGDSITFGYGVQDGDVVTEQVRSLLDSAGVSTEVVNTAIASYNTNQEVAYYEREGHRYDPDVVVVGVCWNDINDKSNVRVNADGYLVDAHTADRPSDPPSTYEYELRNTLKRSRLLYATLERWRAYQASQKPNDHARFRTDVLTGRMTPEVSAGWSQMEASFRRLKDLVADKSRLLIVAFPVPLTLEQSFPASSYPARLREFAARENIEFLDLTDAFRTAFRGHESLFIPFDADHPNAAGHSVAARAIVRVVQPWVS